MHGPWSTTHHQLIPKPNLLKIIKGFPKKHKRERREEPGTKNNSKFQQVFKTEM
jgi:hypothetical protein